MTSQTHGTVTLNISTWNVLADGLAQTGDFIRCPSEFLEWDFRKEQIFNILQQKDADIIFLQEINHIDDVVRALGEEKYRSIFAAKSPSLPEGLGYPADGTAVIYRISKFQILGAEQIRFTDPDGTQHSQCGVAGVLQSTENPDLKFIACSAHFKAKSDDDSCRRRIVEADQLLAHLKKLSLQHNQCHVLLGCDMNDIPHSPPFVRLQSHSNECENYRVDSMKDHSSFNSTGIDEKGASCTCAVLNPVPHASAFTTWKFRSSGEIKRTIDYVWLTSFMSDNLGFRNRVLTPLESSPDDDARMGNDGLPNKFYPSDHLCISTCIEFSKKDEETNPH